MTVPPFAVTHSQIVWSCRWYSVRQDVLRLADGSTAEYNTVQKGPAVFIVPITAAGEVVLIRSYRHPVGEWCWEVPAGAIQAGQTAEQAAVAELREEVGGTAESWQYFGRYFSANGFCDEAFHVYLATGVQLGQPEHEPLEIIEIHPTPILHALHMAQTGQITDGMSALALLLTLGSGGAGEQRSRGAEETERLRD
ncbi:MAG: NUDIX hydrolase [Chloroflexi bacterium]|nr:NUDIX hydrolase [Chloroflexota bacterium]